MIEIGHIAQIISRMSLLMTNMKAHLHAFLKGNFRNVINP